MFKRLMCAALALALAFGVAALAGCSKNEPVVQSSLTPVVFFDDSGKGYVAAEDQSTVIALAEGVKADNFILRAEDAAGKAVSDPSSVALFDEATMTVTAKSAGKLYVDVCKGSKVLETVEVTSMGAYPTDPSMTDLKLQGVNGSHDPSVVEKDGEYYVFTTGWETGGNQIRKSKDFTPSL